MRFNLPSAASWIVGALSLTHPFKKFVDTYFWDKVLHMVEPLSYPLLVLATEYGPALAFGVLGLYFSTSAIDRAAILSRVRKKSSIYYVVAIVAALVFDGDILAATSARQPGKRIARIAVRSQSKRQAQGGSHHPRRWRRIGPGSIRNGKPSRFIYPRPHRQGHSGSRG
jgi:hypothetical protein